MTDLFIPACGDRITLDKQWSFELYLERRNMKFAKETMLVGPKTDDWGVWAGKRYESKYKSMEVFLPSGTILECDRVYIRTFSKSSLTTDNDYDSITWKVINSVGKMIKNHRFWAKLPDCYGISYGSTDLYRDRIKLVKLIHDQ